mgnify:FL=1|tara:strand:+ start:343 stop:528 length:186 start_codon:yes stop_codon:yes gene_type:complete
MNKLKNIYRIVAKIPEFGLHIAYFADDNEFKAMNQMIDKHDITKYDIKSVSLFKKQKDQTQ